MKLFKFLTTAITLFFLAGCIGPLQDYNNDNDTSASGKVVNAMVNPGSSNEYSSLSSAQINFYKRSSNGSYSSSITARGYVSTFGDYKAYDLTPGEYKVTGSKSGWVFVPRYIKIDSGENTVPALSAYEKPNKQTVVVLLSWEDADFDLDASVTYYDGNTRNYIGNIPNVGNTTKVGGIEYNVLRDNINGADDYKAPIERPRDVLQNSYTSSPRVETMVIEWSSFATYVDDTRETYGVPNNMLKYYVGAYNRTLTGIDDGTISNAFSNAQVDVMHTDSYGNTEHYGGWLVPWNTGEKILNVVNISVDSNDGFTIYTGNGSVYDHNSNKTFTVRSLESEVTEIK